MNKETAHLEQQISELTDNVIRYQYAYDVLMEHFDKLPDWVKPRIHKQLKELDL